MSPLLFLDVDGVLNRHRYNRIAQSTTIDRDCVRSFNRILWKTDARVVLSSAWRYMVAGGALSLRGFAYLLRTHGCSRLIDNRLMGTTTPDEVCMSCFSGGMKYETGFVCRRCGVKGTRAAQVRAYLSDHPRTPSYVVVDDLDLGFSAADMNFVQTNGRRGLTDYKADQIIEILNRKVS